MTTPVDVPNAIGIHALVWVGDTARPASDLRWNRQRPPDTTCWNSRCTIRSISTRLKTRELLVQGKNAVACSRGLARDADMSSEDQQWWNAVWTCCRSPCGDARDRRHSTHRRAVQRLRQGPAALTSAKAGTTWSACSRNSPPKPRRSASSSAWRSATVTRRTSSTPHGRRWPWPTTSVRTTS